MREKASMHVLPNQFHCWLTPISAMTSNPPIRYACARTKCNSCLHVCVSKQLIMAVCFTAIFSFLNSIVSTGKRNEDIKIENFIDKFGGILY